MLRCARQGMKIYDTRYNNTNFISQTSIVAFFHDNDMLNIFRYSEAVKGTIQNSKPLEQGKWIASARPTTLSVESCD